MATTRTRQSANKRAPSSRNTNAPRQRGAARAPRSAPAPSAPTLSLAHVKGFGTGLIVGVVIGVVGYSQLLNSGKPQPAGEPKVAAVEPAPAKQKPQYNFFTVLPNQELDLASDVEPNTASSQTSDASQYILQAGSFKNESDADRRRGELALLGLEATVERTTGSNGVWYRVYMGPFESRSQMAKARSLTAQQSIDTLLMKRKIN